MRSISKVMKVAKISIRACQMFLYSSSRLSTMVTGRALVVFGGVEPGIFPKLTAVLKICFGPVEYQYAGRFLKDGMPPVNSSDDRSRRLQSRTNLCWTTSNVASPAIQKASLRRVLASVMLLKQVMREADSAVDYSADFWLKLSRYAYPKRSSQNEDWFDVVLYSTGQAYASASSTSVLEPSGLTSSPTPGALSCSAPGREKRGETSERL